MNKKYLFLALAALLWGTGAQAGPQEGNWLESDPQVVQERSRDWEVVQLFRSGRALQQRGQLERALNLYLQAQELDPQRIEILPYLGLVQYQLGQIEAALATYERYLEFEPQESLVLFNRGVALAALGRWEEAAQSVEPLQEALGRESNYWALRGGIAGSLGDYPESLLAWERARSLDPQNLGATLGEAAALQKLGRLEESRKLLRSGLATHPAQPQLANNLGSVEVQLGQLEEAKSAFQRASGLEVAQINLATLQLLGGTEFDLVSLAALTDAWPQNPKAQLLYGVGLYKAGRYREACTQLEEGLGSSAAPLTPDWILWALQYRALSLMALQEWDLASKAWQEICLTQPNSPQPWHNLALTYLRLGAYRRGISAAQRGLELWQELKPSPAEERIGNALLFNLGSLYRAAGRREEAAETYKLWLERYPQDGKAPRVRAYLKGSKDSSR